MSELILSTSPVEQKIFIPWKATPEDCIQFLKPAFTEVISGISRAPLTSQFERSIAKAFNKLCSAYAEPHRKYHTLNHIGDMILQIQNAPMEPVAKMILSIAAFYHDYVYTIEPKGYDYNEPFSALKWIEDSYVLEFDNETTQRVYCMILATWYSKGVKPIEPIGSVLQDIDFAALGYSLEEYKEINAKVVLELGGVNPTPEFFQKRSLFLNSLLQKEFIFNTDHYRELYDKQAKENITWELSNFLTLYNQNPTT